MCMGIHPEVDGCADPFACTRCLENASLSVYKNWHFTKHPALWSFYFNFYQGFSLFYLEGRGEDGHILQSED